MESEQIQFELFKAVDSPNGWQSLRHLMLKLKKENKENSEKLLDALLGIFFERRHFGYQSAAGGLLWKLKPKYKRNLREDIRLSLKSWDVSVKELPWYFAEITSVDNVRKEINALLTETWDETERKKAETYLYWLSVKNPEEFKKELNQSWNGRLRG